MNKDKNYKVIILVLFGAIFVILGVTYSYFTVASDNSKRHEIEENNATMRLVYTDCDESTETYCNDISGELMPGDSITKSFQVKNDGTISSSYNILFTSLDSSFEDKELVYTLQKNGREVVHETPIAKGTNSNVQIYSTNIDANKIDTYKLTVTFKKLETDQNSNEGSTFDLKLGINSDDKAES